MDDDEFDYYFDKGFHPDYLKQLEEDGHDLEAEICRYEFYHDKYNDLELEENVWKKKIN